MDEVPANYIHLIKLIILGVYFAMSFLVFNHFDVPKELVG